MESLDDLFEETTPAPKEEQKVQEVQETKVAASEPSTLPLETEEDSYDLQKELEAKFDELFGPLDEEND